MTPDLRAAAQRLVDLIDEAPYQVQAFYGENTVAALAALRSALAAPMEECAHVYPDGYVCGRGKADHQRLGSDWFHPFVADSAPQSEERR